MTSTICSILSCIFFIIMYTLLIKFRYKKLVSIILSLLGAVISEGFFLFLISFGLNPSLASILGLTIPSILFFYFISEYHDSRFLFTFCSLDILGMTILFLVKSICHVLNIDLLSPLVLAVIYGLLIYAGFQVKDSYRDIQTKLTSGWRNMSNISVLFYIMYYLMTGYPSPISERPVYVPVICLYSITVLLVYTILFKQIVYMKNTYKFKESEQLLQAQIDLKNSQLEVQKLYYRMAHFDTLTGLKNRYSFEERKSQLSTELNPDSYISCISMDLNNLKTTNDTLGHNIGDDLIKSFANILLLSLENNNDIFRIGGDEFIIFLCCNNMEEIQGIVDKINNNIKNHNSLNSLQISVAIGIKTMSLSEYNHEGIDILIKEADTKMYVNKKEIKTHQLI